MKWIIGSLFAFGYSSIAYDIFKFNTPLGEQIYWGIGGVCVVCIWNFFSNKQKETDEQKE